MMFRGFPLSVYADASGTGARVHAWMTILGASPVLVECTDTGGGTASCDGELGAGEAIDTLVGVVPMDCFVEGKGSGVLICGSGCTSDSLGVECPLVSSPVPVPSI
jgi:hypothetical protein